MKHDNHTFKHKGDIVQVYAISPNEFLMNSFNGGDDVKGTPATMSNIDAAGIMLAIASAANIVHHDPDDTPIDRADRTENMGDLNIAAFYLARHVNNAEKAAHIAAKEAADREVLEAEAFELSNAWRASYDIPPLSSWDQVASPSVFVALARKARELHGGTK